MRAQAPPVIERRSPIATAMLSVAGYLPERIVDNDEVCTRIDSSDEWIQKRSGIRTRHIAADGESVVDLAEVAAREALCKAGVAGQELDAVVFATITHPYQTPAAATELAARLGSRAGAFDLSGACSGFCQGIAVADGLIQAGSARNVLVVGAERLTDFVDWDDRSSAFLFGDGAGAAVIGLAADGRHGIGPVVWGSDGDSRDLVGIRPSWLTTKSQRTERAFVADPVWPVLTMDGLEVYKWAVYEVVTQARVAAEAAGVELDALDAFIPHQANSRIVDDLVRVLRLPSSVAVSRDVLTSANTSAASIPLAMARMLKDGELPHGGLALLMGFGAGLSYAGQVVRAPLG